MTTYTNEDPALPVEDLTPQPEPTIEVDDLNQFVKLLTGWHGQKVKVVRQLLAAPEGMEVMVGEGETFVLTADALKGWRVGLELALSELGALPFAVEYEPEETPAVAGA